MNGNGELTGALWIEESGMFSGMTMLTNTFSFGIVRDSVLRWMITNKLNYNTYLPVVRGIYDGYLNDIRGQHVKQEHVFEAIETAQTTITEGSVGAGAGAVSYDFKAGIGTSSRRVKLSGREIHVGTLVLVSHGSRKEKVISCVIED